MAIDMLNLKTPVPCIKGFFDGRLSSYTTQIRPKQLLNLLGHDPRDKNWKRLQDDTRQIYEFLQRKTSLNRREGVASYIEDRMSPDALTIGAFPAISIAFQEAPDFLPYESLNTNARGAVGELQVDISPTNVRILIDGLGRVTGALNLIDEGKGDILDNFTFPVTIFAPRPGDGPLSWTDMGQLFHDFNFRVQPVAKHHAMRLDQSDIYIAVAKRIGEAWFIRDYGGVANTASLGGKSTELVVQTVLVRTVRGATEGRKFQEANLSVPEEPTLTRDTQAQIVASVEDYFGAICRGMGAARWTNRQSLHLASPGWQALGVVHHDLTFRLKLGPIERAKAIERIAAIDWSRGNPEWIAMGIGQPDIDKKTGSVVVDNLDRPQVVMTGAGRNNAQALIDYVREKAGIASLLQPVELQEA